MAVSVSVNERLHARPTKKAVKSAIIDCASTATGRSSGSPAAAPEFHQPTHRAEKAEQPDHGGDMHRHLALFVVAGENPSASRTTPKKAGISALRSQSPRIRSPPLPAGSEPPRCQLFCRHFPSKPSALGVTVAWRHGR
jgi:hypothetical protein